MEYNELLVIGNIPLDLLENYRQMLISIAAHNGYELSVVTVRTIKPDEGFPAWDTDDEQE